MINTYILYAFLTIHLFAAAAAAAAPPLVFIKLLLSFFALPLFMFPFSSFVHHKMWFSCSPLFFFSLFNISNRAQNTTIYIWNMREKKRRRNARSRHPFSHLKFTQPLSNAITMYIHLVVNIAQLYPQFTYKYRARDKSSYILVHSHTNT